MHLIRFIWTKQAEKHTSPTASIHFTALGINKREAAAWPWINKQIY